MVVRLDQEADAAFERVLEEASRCVGLSWAGAPNSFRAARIDGTAPFQIDVALWFCPSAP